MKSYSFIKLSCFFSVSVLTACQSNWQPPKDLDALPTKVKDTSDKKRIMEIDELRHHGIKVVTIGQNYMISIPASVLFPDESPRIKWSAYEVLNEVAAFIIQFRKVAINVTAYTSFYSSMERTSVLSHARAINVSSYLWAQGIDTRLLIEEGGSLNNPIVGSCSPHKDKSKNSRVEITFRDSVA